MITKFNGNLFLHQVPIIIKKQKMLNITILATPMLYHLGITHC